jgi:hypothetical protein
MVMTSRDARHEERRSDAMQPTTRRIVFYILMFLLALLVLSAPVWLGIGPVVHSETAVTARISNCPTTT